MIEQPDQIRQLIERAEKFALPSAVKPWKTAAAGFCIRQNGNCTPGLRHRGGDIRRGSAEERVKDGRRSRASSKH